MKLCPGQKCRRWSERGPHGERFCYYETGCWKGELDMLLVGIRMAAARLWRIIGRRK